MDNFTFTDVNYTNLWGDSNFTKREDVKNLISCVIEETKNQNISLQFRGWSYIVGFYFELLSVEPPENSSDFVYNEYDTAIYNISVRPEIVEAIDECRRNYRPFLLVWWKQLLWSLAFGAMLSVSVLGNLVVIWIICGE